MHDTNLPLAANRKQAVARDAEQQSAAVTEEDMGSSETHHVWFQHAAIVVVVVLLVLLVLLMLLVLLVLLVLCLNHYFLHDLQARGTATILYYLSSN